MRHAYFKQLYKRETGQTIDHALMLLFCKPQSFTGEDMVEFQIHGSNITKQMLLKELELIPGFRQALPVSIF
jgi:tRNA modification GTPase